MTEELVHYEAADAVATITLDSPRNRNALSRQLITELVEGLGRAEADASVRAVLLRSAGTVFCSGADMSEATAEGMEQSARVIVALQRQIVAMSKPVVTRVEGAVRAGGIGIVAASDVVVSAEDATFALTEVRLGLTPAVISLTVLPRMTSRAAAYACLTGSVFTGEEAVAMGLVTQAVPTEDLDFAITSTLGALVKGSPQGLRETKSLLGRPLLAHIDAHGADLAALSARLFGSDEARHAMLAFLSRNK